MNGDNCPYTYVHCTWVVSSSFCPRLRKSRIVLYSYMHYVCTVYLKLIELHISIIVLYTSLLETLRVCVCVCVCVCACACVCACVCVCVCVCVCTCVNMCICMCTLMYICGGKPCTLHVYNIRTCIFEYTYMRICMQAILLIPVLLCTCG